MTIACGDDADPMTDVDASMGRDMNVEMRCGGGDDPDGDFISSMDEGLGDADGDGLANLEDTDSDGDTLLDVLEAGDMNCLTPPVDTDGDGTPDFLDRDSNADGVPDVEQAETDLDGDGVLDALDDDVDGDGIPNVDELLDGVPVDTDMDGTPDVLDLDSDGDTISDAHEGQRDIDEDGVPNFRDLDSDDDGIDDALEAGDGDVNTLPTTCAEEIDPLTEELGSDGLPDFMDGDQDNDGASDADEVRFGTDLCGIDSDGDGYSDLVEIANEQINCPDGMTGDACGCASNPDCIIPPDDFFVVLPYNGDPEQRDLDFNTDIRVADIFFLTDTTGSMSSELDLVKLTVSTPGTGMIDRVSETIPDAGFSGGQHDDFPFSPHGSTRDEPLIVAIGSTPPSGSAAVQSAFNGMGLHSGADGPESSTEAVYQLMTGEGGTCTAGGSTYTMRRYVGDCLDTGWGAACFREGALPIVVHFTDYCSHNGPPGESPGCSAYTTITPPPAEWPDAMREMNRRGAKYVGINTTNTDCAGMPGGGSPDGRTPCYFMRRTAEESGSIDLDGNALVYDLPDGGGGSTIFVDQVVSAIETVATRVPMDVDTALRDDPSDEVDATDFIKRRQPACRAAPPTDPCWAPPEGITHEQAVAAIDESTFFSAVPGTSVKFRITFQNDFYEGDQISRVFIAFIQVRGSGAAVLDERQVFIVVPARPGGPII